MRRLTLGVLALAAALLLLLPDATPAEAQDGDVTLVSNTRYAAFSSMSRGAEYTQAFTTGSNPQGYRLSSVTFNQRSTQRAGVSTVVTIRKNRKGSANDDIVATLTGSSGPSYRTYTAPANTILQPSTKYWLTVNDGLRSGGVLGSFTSADQESSSYGWSIDNGSFWRDYGRSFNASGNSLLMSVSGVSIMATLDTSRIGDTTATLTIGNYPGNWYFKANTGPHTACSTAQTGTSASLSGLAGSTSYTYTAYHNSGCSAEITSVTFTTLVAGAGWVDNLTETASSDEPFITTINSVEQPFRTSGAATGSRALQSVTVALGTCKITPVVGIYTRDNTGTPRGTQVGGNLTAPNSITEDGDNTYTASGINLKGGADYVVVIRQPATPGLCHAGTTSSDNEFGASGWSIGNDYYLGLNEIGNTIRLRIVTDAPTTLTAGGITQTGATLTIGNHTGNWYYKANTGPHTACSSAGSGTSVSLSGLTPGTGYNYKAYPDSGCSAANEIDSALFTTTASLYVANLEQTSHSTIRFRYVNNSFTTGGAGGARFALDSVIVDFASNATNATVGIYTSDRSITSQVGSDLIRVGSENSGRVTFNAPSGGIILNGNTTYYVLVGRSTDSNPNSVARTRETMRTRAALTGGPSETSPDIPEMELTGPTTRTP